MLFVDPRAGSDDLYKSLVKAGLPATIADPQLPYGDVYFVGRGEKGAGVNIGIEHKKLGDLISSLQTARLQGHQLPGMREVNAEGAPFYDHSWLVIEGKPTYDRGGMLVRPRRGGRAHPLGMTINELYKRLTILHVCGGLNWLWFQTRRDTVKWLEAFYQAWTDKDLDQHKSHLGLYEAPTLTPVSQFERTVRTLPQVGSRVAKSAQKKFGSIRAAITASSYRWADLTTTDDNGKSKKFGMSHAMKVVEAVDKEYS